MTHQLTETECVGTGSDTCDGNCRCESCCDPDPTDQEVIAQLRTQLRAIDLQLKQQNKQCEMLLSKLAEVRRERDELRMEIKSAQEEEEAAEYRSSELSAPTHSVVKMTITQGVFAGQAVLIGPGGGIVPVDGPPAKGTNGL